MSDTKHTPVDAEFEALRKRSAELIAKMATINRRIDEITAGSSDPAITDPAITDTWVEPKPRDDTGPATSP